MMLTEQEAVWAAPGERRHPETKNHIWRVPTPPDFFTGSDSGDHHNHQRFFVWGFQKKKVTNKKENGSSARFSVRLVHVRGRVKAKTIAPSRFPAYLSGELQTHDEIRLDRCSLTRHFVVLCERIRGRHRVPKRLLIITNIIVGSATAVVTTGNSRRPLPWLSETNALATWAPFPPGWQAGETGGGGASVKCGGSRLMMKSIWRRREGRGWGRHGYYWSFFSDSVASSLVSSDDSSYLKKRRRRKKGRC